MAAALFDAALSGEAANLPLPALVERLLEVMVAFGGEQIAFTRLVLQSGGNPQLIAAAASLQADVAERVEGLLASKLRWAIPKRPTNHAP